MGVKSFVTRKAMERQLRNLPASQREMLIKMFERNPDLFEKITKEIKEKKDKGQDEMLASVAVMRKYQGEMQRLMLEIQKSGGV